MSIDERWIFLSDAKIFLDKYRDSRGVEWHGLFDLQTQKIEKLHGFVD